MTTKEQNREHFDLSEAAVAARAFEKWQLRGRPLHDAERDWFEALAEINAARERHRYDEEIAAYE